MYLKRGWGSVKLFDSSSGTTEEKKRKVQFIISLYEEVGLKPGGDLNLYDNRDYT